MANFHEFIKLEIRLLNDPRFFTLSEEDQLMYIKMLLIAKANQGKVTAELPVFKELLRSKRDENDINLSLERLKVNFPKLKSNKHFHFFDGFKARHRMFDSKTRTEIEIEEDKKKNKILKSICLKYQEVKQITSVDTDWWKRHMQVAKKLLATYNSLETVCWAIDALCEKFRASGLNWTLETVLKQYTELCKPEKTYK